MNSVSQNQNQSPKAAGGGTLLVLLQGCFLIALNFHIVITVGGRLLETPPTSFVGGDGAGSKINTALKAIQELQVPNTDPCHFVR